MKEDQAFIIDECNRMIAVDLTNDEIRTVCSNIPLGVVMLPQDQGVLVFDPGSRGVFSIELPDCRRIDRRMLSLDSSNALGLVAPGSVAIDSARNRAIIIDTYFQELFILDLSNDALIPLRGGSTGTGPRLWAPRGLAVDWQQKIAYVADKHVGALFSIDLENGSRTIVSDTVSCTEAQLLENPLQIALHPTSEDVFIINEQAQLIAVNRWSGDCRIISDHGQGIGPSLLHPRDIAVWKNVAYVADWGLDALLEVDLKTGDRTVVSDKDNGFGPPIKSPLSIALDCGLLDDPCLHAYLTLQEHGAVFKIDLSTGERTVVSDKAEGHGLSLLAPLDMALGSSAEDDELFILDLSLESVVRVDAKSGDRNGISGGLIGSGPLLTEVASIAIDATRDVALVVDAHLNSLVLVDLLTGDRVIVSR